jgi:hypothetical protein
MARQAVEKVASLGCPVGARGFLKEASTCRIEAACNICIQHISWVLTDYVEDLLYSILA